MNIILSIIIPCYNQGHFLEEALSNLVDLKPHDFEVIVVNDGSNDGKTPNLIDDLVAKYSNYFAIKAMHQQNQGLAMARNNAIANAKGAYIAPLDADNKLVPDFIEKAIKILEEHKEYSIVHGNPIFFGDNDLKRHFKVESFDLIKMLRENYFDACSVYRKEVWLKNNGYDALMPKMGHEDWEFWLHAYVNGFKFKYLNEPAFYYRIVSDSMLTQTVKKGNENQTYIFSKHAVLFKELFEHEEQLTQKYNVLKTLYLKDSQSPIRAFIKNFYRNLMGKKIDWL